MTAAMPMERAATGGRHITVLQSIHAVDDATNPYLVQLFRALPDEVHLQLFSMRRALLGGYDLLHVHWPEYLVRHRTRLGTWFKQACMALLLVRLKVTGTPVVRTLHNLEPHEQPGLLERLLLAWLDRCTTRWIRLNATTPPRLPATETILHGHYRNWYAGHAKSQVVPGRLLYFGLIRPYKGVEALIAAIGNISDPDISVRIVGQPRSDDMRAMVEHACEHDRRVSANLRYVDDATVAEEVSAAELVVLPYRKMHNSGALLLALSLGRPVLAPWNAANEAIATEVGAGWVHCYRGEFDAAAIRQALGELRSGSRSAVPDLSLREWGAAGQAHYRAYMAALGRPQEAS